MARIGKIARLPQIIRDQINTRLRDGEGGKQLLQWLNSLPKVKKALAQSFDSRPVNEQNLSDWRLGGYQEWLTRQEILDHATKLAALSRTCPNAAAPAALRFNQRGNNTRPRPDDASGNNCGGSLRQP